MAVRRGDFLLLGNLDRQDWQDDAESCSVALIIGSSKTTIMGFDNGAGHSEPDAHSLALGRDECIEYAVAANDSRPVIDDIEQHGLGIKGARGNENPGCASRVFRGIYPVRD